jgi:hypothetical protein
MRRFQAFLFCLAIGFGLVALFTTLAQRPDLGGERASTALAVSKDHDNA